MVTLVKPKVATVLTACGIETSLILFTSVNATYVATVLTACGIETLSFIYGLRWRYRCNSTYRLRY